MRRARRGAALGRLSHGAQALRVSFAQHLGVCDEGVRVRSATLEPALGEPSQRQGHARARGELRSEGDLRAAVIALRGRDDTRPVLPEILGPEHAVHRADVLGDRSGDFAFVEVAAPGAREPSQGIGESGELEPSNRRIRRRDGRHSRREPDVAGDAVARELRRQGRDLERQIPVDCDSFFRQIDRRLQDRGEGSRAEALEREAQAVHFARKGERQRSVDVAVLRDRRPGEEIACKSPAQREIGGG